MKKVLGAVLVAWLSITMVGCAGYVRKDQYDRDIDALKHANEDLSRRNSDLESRLAQQDYQRVLAERYGQLTEEIKRWIKGLPEGSGIEITDKGVAVTDILFELGRAEIKPKGKELLKELAGKLKSAGNNLQVVGHTDDVPIKASRVRYGIETNLELGALRAKNVMLELKKAGIPETKMFLASSGQNSPRGPNTDKTSRAKNRRVEINLLK